MSDTERSQVLGFERELLYAFRGELRRVRLDPLAKEETVGTQCRIAAAVVGEKLRPYSETGVKVYERYRGTTSRDTLYSGAPSSGNRRDKRDLISVARLDAPTKETTTYDEPTH